MPDPSPDGRLVLFYDGVCGLCNRLVRFLVRRDRADRFRFASLQSAYAQKTLAGFGRDPRDLDTVYALLPDGRLLDRGRAILAGLAALGGAWKLSAVFRIVPTFVLDLVYRLVARTRYRIFGKLDTCELPTPEEREKFIDL